jgi:hypothetical protein
MRWAEYDIIALRFDIRFRLGKEAKIYTLFPAARMAYSDVEA